jgi:hypothetical protein
MWGALSVERGRVCHLQFLLVLISAIILGSESRGTHDYILLSQIWDCPNLEGQVPVFISPRNRVAQLYPQALGSLFVASYYSQGYGGGIRTRLHAGFNKLVRRYSVKNLDTNRIEKIVFNSSVVACASVTTAICLPCHCLALAVSSGSTIPGFSRRVTIVFWWSSGFKGVRTFNMMTVYRWRHSEIYISNEGQGRFSLQFDKRSWSL